jgi:hypothetical protein
MKNIKGIMKGNKIITAILICLLAAASGNVSAVFAADGEGGENGAAKYAAGEFKSVFWNGGLREIYVTAGERNYLHGCIDEEGNVIVAPAENGPYVGITNGLVLINEGARDANGIFIPAEAKCAVLNAAGERVRSLDNYITWYDGTYGIAAVSASGNPRQMFLYALTDETGTPITAYEFEDLSHNPESSPGVFWAKKNGLWGCMKGDGSVLLPFVYRAVYGFDSRLTHVGIVTEDGKEGLANYDGAIVVPAEYRSVAGFAAGLAPVMNDDAKWAYFNTAGENVTGFVWDYQVFPFKEGLARFTTEDGKYGFMDTDFRTVLQPAYTGFGEGSGFDKPGHVCVIKDGVTEFVENPLQYERTVNIYADGNWIYTEQEPFIESGRTLAPFRKVAEALGYQVQWFPESREITLASATRLIRMTVGATEATVNVFDDGLPAETVTLDVPPRIVGGRTYVPLRFIAENCGAGVEWDEATKAIRITS